MPACIVALGFSVLFTIAIAADSDKKVADKRPSILFCLADDWGWPHAGVYGDKVVRVPAFDRIAREGVLFTHAFSVAPSCTPSRASILTGQAPHRLGEGASLYGPLDNAFSVYQSVKKSLRQALQHWMENTADPILVHSHEPWDDYRYGGPMQ